MVRRIVESAAATAEIDPVSLHIGYFSLFLFIYYIFFIGAFDQNIWYKSN